MSEMQVYVDASGSEAGRGTPFLSAGGAVASADTWSAFHGAWTDVLERVGIKQFSMEEYSHSTGEFKTWRSRKADKVALLRALIDVTKRHEVAVRSVSIEMRDWWALNLSYQAKESFGGPYAMCASLMLYQLRNVALAVVPSAPVELFVERGDCNQQELLDLCERDINGLRPVLRSKKERRDDGSFLFVRPFELADMCAYESRLYVQRPDRDTRRSAWALQEEVGLQNGHLPLDRMMRVCIEFRIPPRGATVDYRK